MMTMSLHLLFNCLLILCLVGFVLSIPDTEYYDVLGLEISATELDIKRAFRRLSQEKHPDKNSDPNAQEEYLKIVEAHEILSDPDKRHMYDMYGKEGVSNFNKKQQRGGGQGGGIFSMFENFFGGQGGGGRGQMANMGNMPTTRDAMIELGVSLKDLYLGGMRELSYKRNVICNHCRGTGAEGGETKKCPKCHGQGHILVEQNIMPGFRMQTQQTCPKCKGKGQIYKHQCGICHGSGVHPQITTLSVDIEKGMVDGQEIKFERKAEEKPGHIPGNVIVKLKQEPHQYFQRRGDNLFTAVEITLTQALLGFDLNIEHMDEHWVNLKHDGITSYAQTRTYEDEGMPHHNVPSEFGDMNIEYRVTFPDKISQDQRSIIANLFDDSDFDLTIPPNY